jgi:hypothetical protein
VPAILAVMFVALFGVFGRPEIGCVFAAIVLLPIALGAWLDYALLVRRARGYQIEHALHLREKELRGRALEKETTSQPEGPG